MQGSMSTRKSLHKKEQWNNGTIDYARKHEYSELRKKYSMEQHIMQGNLNI